MAAIRRSLLPLTWTEMPEGIPCILVPLARYSLEFDEVLDKLGMKPLSWKGDNPTEIFRIQNPTIYKHFLMTKREYEEDYSDTKVLDLWHATDRSRVDSIVSKNFLIEKAEDLNYGPAVAFSNYTFYADAYAHYKLSNDRAMILSKVLVGESVDCTFNFELPASSNITVQQNYERVYLKYDNHSFYPTHVLWYSVESSNLF